MHYTPYTQVTWGTRRALPSQQSSNANKSTHPRMINTNKVTTGKTLETFLRRVQRRPSARGQEELPHKGGERVDQEASSLWDKGQRVALEKRRSRQGRSAYQRRLRTLWALRIVGVSVRGDWGWRHGWSRPTAVRWGWIRSGGRGRGHVRSRS